MKEFEFNFSKKNILIVGGSSGIGYQAAILFSQVRRKCNCNFEKK